MLLAVLFSINLLRGDEGDESVFPILSSDQRQGTSRQRIGADRV